MDNNRNGNIIHEIIPKFNFIYELGMPTGRKIKNTIFLIILFIIGYVIAILNKNNFAEQKIMGDYSIFNIINIVAIAGVIISVIKLIIHIILQSSQYNNITFKFYDDHMIYEDNFLNQHRKNIEYQNIKEVEIRRTIWDRIFGYGIIIIYTNAENEYSNGLVIFGIKDPKKHYDIIDNLVHTKTENIISDMKVEEVKANIFEDKYESQEVNEEKAETREEFLESLKNIEK